MAVLEEIDAAKAAAVAHTHAISVSSLASFTFRLISVDKNTQENIWKVVCEYYGTAADKAPTRYVIKVDVSKGTVVSIATILPAPKSI